VVLFEAPHRLPAMLADLAQVAGGERRLTLARELTKRFEEIHTLPVSEMSQWLQADEHRGQGEFVLVVHAPVVQDEAGEALSAEHVRLMRVLLAELSVRDAVRIGVRATGVARDALYAWALAQREGAGTGD